MNYKNGIKVQAGDKVKLDGSFEGVVVFCIENDDYIDDFPKKEWAYLKQGIMVKSEEFGLVHHKEINEDIEFVERAKNITTQ